MNMQLEVNGYRIEEKKNKAVFAMIASDTGLDRAIAERLLLAGNPIRLPAFTVRLAKKPVRSVAASPSDSDVT